MIYPQVVSYVKNSLEKKVSLEQIKKSLLEKGWKESDINEAIALANQSVGIKPTVKKTNLLKKDFSSNVLFIVIGVVVFIVVIGVVIFLLANGTSKITDEEILQGATVGLKVDKEAKFRLGAEEHRLFVDDIHLTSADITIYSSPIKLTLSIGQEEKIDLDSDDVYDLLVRLESITNSKANFYIKEINEPICFEEWECTDWGACVDSIQLRNCTDMNECGIEENKPTEIQSCIVVVELTCDDKNGSICEFYEECDGTLEEDCCLGNCSRIVPIACGTDIDCFINASDTCHPANLTHSVFSSNSTISNVTYFYSIDGFEDETLENCGVYSEVIDVEGNFTESQWAELLAVPETPEAITIMIEEIHSNLIGDYGVCTLSTHDLEDYLVKVKTMDYQLTPAEVLEYECTGSLF